MDNNNTEKNDIIRKTKLSGENISTVFNIVAIVMIIGMIGVFATGNIGIAIAMLVGSISIFILGLAVKALFGCIAIIAENAEKQVELLEEMSKNK
ncbi:hypothetical protein HYH39_06080 [Clostridium botulinum]|nr:hypothetical protein KU40_05280 [Clostridium botulinum]MBY6778510.1 hypothetical protein [Clostridium botulinum]MBY6851689.1 hypothetical protein [Clostridium botulinum]NFF21779.1 hypothetical protein [Clostridium botulinum]NFF37574.1 hypothetical protein [Clostridium botulinum]